MIRLVFAFIILSALIHFGIMAWQKMSGSERWTLTKTAIYSILVALLAVMLMTVFVIAF